MEVMVQSAQETARVAGNNEAVRMLPIIPPKFNPFWSNANAKTVSLEKSQTEKGSSSEEP